MLVVMSNISKILKKSFQKQLTYIKFFETKMVFHRTISKNSKKFKKKNLEFNEFVSVLFRKYPTIFIKFDKLYKKFSINS